MKTSRLKNFIVSKLYRPKGKKKPAAGPAGTIAKIDRELSKRVNSLQELFLAKGKK